MSFRLDARLAVTSLCAGLLLSTNAWAANDDHVGLGKLAGEKEYKNLVIDGLVGVTTYTVGDADSGWLWIKADSITIEPGGGIDANAAGYQGADAGGSGHLGGEGGTPTLVPGVASPGGGGAHFGAGGPGNDGGCLLFVGAEGGSAYDLDSAAPLALVQGPLGMGSAGGTGNSGSPNDHIGPGGAGGGVVILSAATINIQGPITADGDDGKDTLSASPGGGGGGSILIESALLTFGPAALLSAHGGKGAEGNSYGGGGGGGLIVVRSTAAAQPLIDSANVQGGDTESCGGNQTVGMPGLAVLDITQDCTDADEDGYPSVACGGDDCQDGDPDINVNQDEECDGEDNNCNGDNNEPRDGMCPTGLTCDPVAETCVPVEVDGGTGTGGAEAGPEIDLHGGLCSSIAPLGSSPGTVAKSATRVGPVALLVALLGLAGVVRRRSRR